MSRVFSCWFMITASHLLAMASFFHQCGLTLSRRKGSELGFNSAGYEYDGGIIITASHLPFNRNGFKFFTKEGGLEKANIKDLLQRATAAAHSAGLLPNARHTDDASVMDAALNIEPSLTPKVSSTCFVLTPQLWLPMVS